VRSGNRRPAGGSRPLFADPIDAARPSIAVSTAPLVEPEPSAGVQAPTAPEAPAEPPSAMPHAAFGAVDNHLPDGRADLAAALPYLDEPLPARWQPRGSRHEGVDPFPAPASVAESEATPAGHAATSVWPKPPFVVSSDPPFTVPNDSPVAGTPSIPGGTDFLNELPSTPPDPLPIAPRSDPPAAKRRKASRSQEESALQTFEDSFFAAGAHPSIHSDDDASFDSGRSGLGSTQPPVRGGRDVDSFGPLPSARTERASDSFRDEALGEKFAALASASARAARRRRRATIAGLCLVAVVGVLAAYQFFGNGVRIDLSADELRSAASMSTTPLVPTPVDRGPEAAPTTPDAGIAKRTAPGAAALAPAAPTPVAPTVLRRRAWPATTPIQRRPRRRRAARPVLADCREKSSSGSRAARTRRCGRRPMRLLRRPPTGTGPTAPARAPRRPDRGPRPSVPARPTRRRSTRGRTGDEPATNRPPKAARSPAPSAS
jgi:hypothetical protein